MANRKLSPSRYIVVILLLILLTAISVFCAFECGTEIKEFTSGNCYTQSATKFDEIDTKYTPDIAPGGDHIRQQFEVRNDNMSAIDVRVKHKKDTLIMGNLTFELRDDAGNVLKTYVLEASLIENWHYVSFPLDGISLQKGETYSVDIYMEEGQLSGVYNLYLSGMNIDENIQLYCNDAPIEGQLDVVYTYEYSQFVFEWKGLALLFVVLMLFGLFSIQTGKGDQSN